MADTRANIKVGREFYERHNARREELGVTWEEYIDSQAPDGLADLRESVRAIEERTGRIERAVEALGEGRGVNNAC